MGELTRDCAGLLAEHTPLIDVRAPAEFARGALPDAVNLPLLTDDERHQVGIRYKRDGAQAAFELGERLVSGATKAVRLRGWAAFLDAHPNAVLYCWRGGTRSEVVQTWLAEQDRPAPRVVGGYKALRRFCLQALEQPARWLVLAGRAGSGKTAILRDIPGHIDLEGLANHRGSAFGARATPQPTPINFENALAVALIQRRPVGTPLAVEDESRTIGRLAIPQAVFAAMQAAPLVLVEVEREARIEQIVQDYVLAPDAAAVRLATALDKIERRLGGKRHRQVRERMTAAFAGGNPDAHRRWVGMLLDWYYDPMYDHQLAGKRRRIVFRGDTEAVRAYLAWAAGEPRWSGHPRPPNIAQ